MRAAQCVRIAAMDKEVLRTGVRARVTLEFMYRPEFLQMGTKVSARPVRYDRAYTYDE